MLTLVLSLALLVPLIWVVKLLLVTKAIVGLEFRRQTVVAVPSEAIPAHLCEAVRPWIKQLEALGFSVLGGWRVEWEGEPSFNEDAVVLTHGVQPVRAVIRPYGDSSRSGECWVELRTATEKGFEIITASHEPEQL